jgi:predicted nucleic acid-binding protein
LSLHVVDTSVLLAWYLPEHTAAQARAWRSQALSGTATLVVPGLHFWEFGNVLRSYVMRKELSGELAREIYDTHLQAPLEIREPERASVMANALSFGATVYDAVFITLSLELEVPLITAERSTSPWLVKLGKRAIRLG